MLRRHCPVSYKHIMVSDSETESDDNINSLTVRENRRSNKTGKGDKFLSSVDPVAKPLESKANVDRDALVELATKYQKCMKKFPIPRARLEYAVVVNWQGLAKTLKNLYGQPLHYLTYKLCKEWDGSRFGSEDEDKPLDAIIDWSSAEATLWKVEEVHRLCTSPIHLAKLWLSDPEYQAFVDEVVPSP